MVVAGLPRCGLTKVCYGRLSSAHVPPSIGEASPSEIIFSAEMRPVWRKEALRRLAEALQLHWPLFEGYDVMVTDAVGRYWHRLRSRVLFRMPP